MVSNAEVFTGPVAVAGGVAVVVWGVLDGGGFGAAVADGMVCANAGPADGFGGWVCIDGVEDGGAGLAGVGVGATAAAAVGLGDAGAAAATGLAIAAGLLALSCLPNSHPKRPVMHLPRF